MIPHLIHQIWIGDKPQPQKWMDTWKRFHPDWKYILWDNERVNNFVFKNKEKIDGCIKKGLYHGAADLIRYEILYRYGGFVAPADSECFSPIDELLNIEEDCFACYENEIKLGHLISPHLATTKGNDLMKELIDKMYGSKKPIIEPWQDTGNVFLTRTVKELNYPIKIYPSHYFVPNHYSGEKYTGTDKIYADHKWGTTKKLYESFNNNSDNREAKGNA